MPPPHPRPRRWPWWLVWLLLALYFLSPPREVFDQSLDKSNYATYAHFVARGMQWGGDVIPMTGPLGFLLYGHTYSGELFGPRLVGDLLLKAAFAALLLHLFRRAGPGPVRWAWLVGVVLLVPTVDDLFHDFAILVATLVLLANLGRPNAPAVLGAVLLGVLALFKGTHLVTTAACFGSVVVLGAWERRWRGVALYAALYLGALLGAWVLAGQRLANLPVYLRGVRELSSGYNASMGLEAGPLMLPTGLALAAGLLALLVHDGARHARGRAHVVALLLLAGFSFIKWKHGFLRADGHVFIFFTSVAVVALTARTVLATPLLAPPADRAPGAFRPAGLALLAAVTGLGVLASADFWLWRVYRIAADAPAALYRNVRFVGQPTRFRAALDAELERVRREAQVPQIRNEIGQDPVDFFGFEQGLLLLNGFNYRPRPMGGGSFNVFTRWLQDRNEAFVRDPARAPRWQVMKLQTLDDRLPTADDPLTLRAVLTAYSPVLMQRDYLLLRRRVVPAEFPPPQLLSQRNVRPGDEIEVPAPEPGRMVLFVLRAPLSVGGTIRSFLHRPPELQARVFSALHPNGRTFALKPTMLRRPVILSPLLLDNGDVIRLYGDEPGNVVTRLRLEPVEGFADEAMTILFYSAERPAPPEGADVGEILTYRQYPLHNRPPVEMSTEETGIRELNKEPVSLVHAPGRIAWDLAPGDQQVIFSFGLMPQSYLEGATDGVEFVVEAVPPEGPALTLYRRLLTPTKVEADRGMQRARVFLPPKLPAGSRLRIRTEPGPDRDGAWDQSYLTRLQIKSGPPDPRQYVGFNVPPLGAGFADRPEYPYDGGTARSVHPPAELAFPIAPGSRRVLAGFGLMPGSFEGEGRTDGVAFSFAVRRPAGADPLLGVVLVEPARRAADRVPQALDLALPPLPAGSVLVLRTGAGPRGDIAWDWAVLRTLIIE